MSLSAFMAQNVVQEENIEYVASKRFIDEKTKKPIAWELRCLDSQRGDGAMNLWSLEGGYNNYLATSPGGTATGFGASLLVVDDLIKSYEEACNEDRKSVV